MIQNYLKEYRSSSRRFYKRKYNPIYYIGQCSSCLDIFSIYIDDIEGVEPFLFTFFEYGSTSNEIFESWVKKNNIILKFEVHDGDLVHKCGGQVKLWTMNKFFR